MPKQKQNLSATAMLRGQIPVILKKHSEGLTFEGLWEELFKNKKLSEVMVNKYGKKRLGLLQGLTNRIKDNKEENILLIKKEDGKNYFIYYDSSFDRINKLTNNYISSVNKIEIDKSDIPKEKQKILIDYQELLVKLESLNKKLQDSKSVNKSEIETKSKIKETTTKK